MKLNHKKIAHLLDRSADRIDRATLKGLQLARQQALQHQRVTPSVWQGWDGILLGHRRALSWGIATIVATLLLVNLTVWQSSSEHNRGHIDIAILTDEMPVDVYVD
jgi:Protein of unknown function (DUF3619)